MRFSPVELAVAGIVILALFGKTLIPKLAKRIKDSKDASKEALKEIKGEEVNEA